MSRALHNDLSQTEQLFLGKLDPIKLAFASMALLCFASGSQSATLHDYPVTRIIDGDTVEFEATFLPPPLKPLLSVRVNSVDTPEKPPRAKCQKEAELAVAASSFTRTVLQAAKSVQIELKSWDKYGGRVLGDILYDGKWLSEQLIVAGYAVPYSGGKKSSWCD